MAHGMERLSLRDLLGLPAAAQVPEDDPKKPDNSETVHVSALALIKMMKHARSGVPLEVMGILLGNFVDDYTIQVIDTFCMPQRGSAATVESFDPAYQARFMELLKYAGRQESAVGWYHSHPGFDCWLSPTDLETQQRMEKLHGRCIAIVIDPIQSVKGKVVVDAFRSIDPMKMAIKPTAFSNEPRQASKMTTMSFTEWIRIRNEQKAGTGKIQEGDDPKKGRDAERQLAKPTDFTWGAEYVLSTDRMESDPLARNGMPLPWKIDVPKRNIERCLLGIRHQSKRLNRHLYVTRLGAECSFSMIDHFATPRHIKRIKNEWTVWKALVCEVMAVNPAFRLLNAPLFHVRFWLPSSPHDFAWISLPFGGKHFPDLPADFAIGQYYEMTLELEQLSNNSMVLRAKNHNRSFAFHELYRRHRTEEKEQGTGFRTFYTMTVNGDRIDTIQLMDNNIRRTLASAHINLQGKVFDLVNTWYGNAIAMSNDNIFQLFPPLEPGKSQVMTGVLEPLPNGRVALYQVETAKQFVDWRLTNLYFDGPENTIQGPVINQVEKKPDFFEGKLLSRKKTTISPTLLAFSVCRKIRPPRKAKTLSRELPNYDETFDLVRGIIAQIRREHRRVKLLSGYSDRDLYHIFPDLEQRRNSETLKLNCIKFIMQLIAPPGNFEAFSKLGTNPPALACCMAEFLHSFRHSIKQFLPMDTHKQVDVLIDGLYLKARANDVPEVRLPRRWLAYSREDEQNIRYVHLDSCKLPTRFAK